VAITARQNASMERTVEHDLDYRDQVFINFRDFFRRSLDHAFRWVDLKRFCLPRTARSDTQILDALIRHVQFRDDYAGGGVDPVGTRHGPYWLDRISVDAYELVDETRATCVLHVWASQYGELSQTLKVALERDVHSLVRAATSRYRLMALGEDALHDWGGVHCEFHELVVIDRSTNSLALIVAADD
jgi:hypothetical protein